MEHKQIHFAPQLIGDLLNIIHNAIFVVDSRQKIIFVNSRTAKMFRTSVGQLQDRHITRLFMPDDTDILVTNILDIIRRDGEYEGEAMFRRLDGSTFLGLIAGTYFTWDNQQDGMAFTIHDISAMKSIEQSLRRSERIAFLGRLIDDISHQIRNPVTVIGGFARRLVADNICSAKARAILKEASYLEDLVETLDKFVKLSRPRPAYIPFEQLIRHADLQLCQTAHDSGCSWICNYDQGLMGESLLVDQTLLFEALELVVMNACESYDKTTSEKPVMFQARFSEDPGLPYTISISDNGVGIPEQHVENVFSHFYSNKTKHIGMGLTFARRIMEEQMGKITIESNQGKGTCITFHLVKERRRDIRIIKIA